MDPTTKLGLSTVPRYLDQHHGIEVTRQSVYNWAKSGRYRIILKTAHGDNNRLYTTPEWINEFLRAFKRRRSR
jgi:hypothetical protein